MYTILDNILAKKLELIGIMCSVFPSLSPTPFTMLKVPQNFNKFNRVQGGGGVEREKLEVLKYDPKLQK